MKRFSKLMVANRSEIAIRVLRAATELDIRTVAIYSHEDRFALHRFKADEAYQVGAGLEPVAAYLDIEGIIDVAKAAKVDAIHPGYGFLSENPDFAEACAAAGITFVGPKPDVMRRLGSKVEARNLAESAGLAVMPATGALPHDEAEAARLAAEIGFPVMAKASWGGGGRGMRMIERPEDLAEQVAAGRRESKAAFGSDEIFLEKLVRRARHVEVQLLGDTHGNVVHLFERDCSMQRRNQKVVERAPAPYLTEQQRDELCESAVRLAKAADYENAGTAEFLMDVDTGKIYFIEVNPRIQVEHTVTEAVTGIDIVKAQIRIAQGAKIGTPESGVLRQERRLNGHALQCRVTTEDPQNKFIPDYGRITAYRGANGFGIRLDGGTAYSGALITPFYDSLLEKVTAWGRTPNEAVARMNRALREFRIRGVATNLLFLETLIDHPSFQSGDVTTRFIDDTPELFDFPPPRDRATRLLTFMGDVLVNGNPEVANRPLPGEAAEPHLPELPKAAAPAGSRQRLDELGPEGFAKWMLDQKQLLLTDTTMRDAHQSLLATRMRSYDMLAVAPHYARLLPELLSLECWGGATFDVAMRFLNEDPWERLAGLREAVPNLLLQMLLRGANGVGYKNYPDNVVHYFVEQAADAGIDLFRVFDALNWVDNMRLAIDAVCETGKLCEAVVCYSGDLTDPQRDKFDLKYYVRMAKELEAAGAHILGIKDMAGLCKPAAAKLLVFTLKQEIGIPIHFHTHDTSGISAASVLAAAEAGVDAADGAMDSMSGLTSQPNLSSIAEALRGSERDPDLNTQALREIANYWEDVRRHYKAFESEMRAGSASVFQHEMPGGQYTNLREQEGRVGLGLDRHPFGGRRRRDRHVRLDVDALGAAGPRIRLAPNADHARLCLGVGAAVQDEIHVGRVRRDDEGAVPELAVEMLRVVTLDALPGAEPLVDRAPGAHEGGEGAHILDRRAAAARGGGEARVAVLVDQPLGAHLPELLADDLEGLLPGDRLESWILVAALLRVGPLHRLLDAVRVVGLLDQAEGLDADAAAAGVLLGDVEVGLHPLGNAVADRHLGEIRPRHTLVAVERDFLDVVLLRRFAVLRHLTYSVARGQLV